MRRPSATSNLRVRLRSETAALHGRLERGLNLVASDLSSERYVRVLRALHGYHAPLERDLASLPWTAAVTLRSRAPFLVRDLVTFGASLEEVGSLPRCARLPALETRESLAGCLYVIEGATLGGQVLTRALRRSLGLTPERGCVFFSDGGVDPAPRWRAVLSWLDAVDAELGSEGIVASARETFRTLALWLATQGVLT